MKHCIHLDKLDYEACLRLIAFDILVIIWVEGKGFRGRWEFEKAEWSSLEKAYQYVYEHYDSIIEQAKVILVKEML